MSISPLGNFLEVEDVASWLNLDGSELQAQLQAAVDSANDAVLDELDWDPRSQTVTEMVDGTGARELRVERFPITAVSAINHINECGTQTPVDLTNVTWHLKFGIIYNPCRWCAGDANYLVTYTAGLKTVPNAILQAVRYAISGMLSAAGVDMNSTGEQITGVLSQTWQQAGPGSLPVAAKTLLTPYRRKF